MAGQIPAGHFRPMEIGVACRYKDYVMTGSGLQYTDLVQGTGEMPKPGDTVVIDWDGYTIGKAAHSTICSPYMQIQHGCRMPDNDLSILFRMAGASATPLGKLQRGFFKEIRREDALYAQHNVSYELQLSDSMDNCPISDGACGMWK